MTETTRDYQALARELMQDLELDKETQALLMASARDLERMQKRQSKAGFTRPTQNLNLPKLPQVPKNHKPPTLRQKVEQLQNECQNCDGRTCRKIHMQWYQPVIRICEVRGDEYVAWQKCDVLRQRQAARQMRDAISSAKIPARYVGKTFDDYAVDESNRDAVLYARNINRINQGAYFYGSYGTGKTFLASLIALDFAKAGKRVTFVKVPSLLDDLRATFNGKGSEFDILDSLAASDLVVLDDFGMEKPTQWSGSTLCKVLDRRYDGGGVTIITSNLSIDELERQLNHAADGKNVNGSRIADRCRELCKPVLFHGTTRRN